MQAIAIKGGFALETKLKNSLGEVPGLYLLPEFFAAKTCETITRQSLKLFHKLEQATPEAHGQNVSIPQPELIKSENHNLPSEEKFLRLEIDDDQDRKLSCEYFPTYGERGHALGYFRGNRNLPSFISEGCLPRIRNLVEQYQLANREGNLIWRLTANFYKSTPAGVAGFPFHVDIPANGIVTMILNIQREATFQIAKENTLHELRLPVGALLILSGESRYEWQHRVLPEHSLTPNNSDDASSGTVKRVSLVLGFK